MMKEKYETLPLTTLKELAKARGLKGISTMKKAQVIELMLQEDEKEQEKEKQEKRETAELTSYYYSLPPRERHLFFYLMKETMYFVLKEREI